MRPHLWTNVVSCFLAMAPAAWAQATANNTTSQSSAEIDTYVVSQVNQTVTTYKTELRANLQGLPPLYDQSVNAGFNDPAFQNLIAQAQNVLYAAGAVSLLNPTLIIGNTSQSSSTSSVLTPGPKQVVPVVTTYVGPASPLVGYLGICQSYTLALTGPQFTNCTGGTATVLNVPAGSQDVDTTNISLVTINQTSTTTTTYLTTQLWDIVGITANNQTNNNQLLPTSPVPPSLLLSLVGLACVGFWVAYRQRRAA